MNLMFFFFEKVLNIISNAIIRMLKENWKKIMRTLFRFSLAVEEVTVEVHKEENFTFIYLSATQFTFLQHKTIKHKPQIFK